MKLSLRNFLFRIRNKFRKQVIIPHYDEKRAILLEYKNRYRLDYFIETGTFLGDTIEFFRDKFKYVYSIELSNDLALRCSRRFENFANVKIIHGDSGEVLSELITEIKSPGLFWLDGHYSSEFFVGDEFIRTAKGEKDTPIEKELNVILNSPMHHIILIDDARLFTGQKDYPSIAKIRKIVKKSTLKFNVFVQKDIINIIPIQ